MESISDYLNSVFFYLPEALRVLFIFTFALVEGLPVIGTLFPGGTIALFIGVLSNEGFITPFMAILIISFGSFIGDMTGFLIGKKLKHKKWVRKIIEHEKHQKKWDIFDRHIVLIILFSRVVPLVRSLPSLFAGARNVRTRKYIILSFIGSFIWAIGGVFGGNIISRFTGKLAVPVIFGILITSIIIALVMNFRKKK